MELIEQYKCPSCKAIGEIDEIRHKISASVKLEALEREDIHITHAIDNPTIYYEPYYAEVADNLTDDGEILGYECSRCGHEVCDATNTDELAEFLLSYITDGGYTKIERDGKGSETIGPL